MDLKINSFDLQMLVNALLNFEYIIYFIKNVEIHVISFDGNVVCDFVTAVDA